MKDRIIRIFKMHRITRLDFHASSLGMLSLGHSLGTTPSEIL